MLQPDFTKVTTDLFQVLAEEAAALLDGDPQILSLIKGEQPYTNKGAATAGGFGSLFFDAVYWQLSVIYGVAKNPQTTQLQAPNDGLVRGPVHQVPRTRKQGQHHGGVDPDPRREWLPLASLAMCLGDFPQQHKNTRLPWVVQVSVY